MFKMWGVVGSKSFLGPSVVAYTAPISAKLKVTQQLYVVRNLSQISEEMWKVRVEIYLRPLVKSVIAQIFTKPTFVVRLVVNSCYAEVREDSIRVSGGTAS